MDSHILVNAGGHCFAGALQKADENGAVLKQSEKSGIMVRIPLELCSYVIHVSGERYSGKEELTAFFNRILA